MPEANLPDGVTLVYDERGDRRARALVLLHGVSMSRRYFHRQLDALGERHRVIAVDLRGHGESAKVETGHTIPQYARDLARFIELLELEQPVLLGWSMGAFVAWEYLQQFGTAAIAGLIVCDEAASDFKWDGFEHGFLDLAGLHSLMSDVQEDREGFLRHLVPLMFHREQRQDDVDWMVAECMKLPVGPLSAILFDQSVRDYRESVGAIDIPTLICWGRHDGLLAVSGADDLQKRIPHAEIAIFENSGHCPFLEESAKFNATVDAFLKRLEGQSTQAAATPAGGGGWSPILAQRADHVAQSPMPTSSLNDFNARIIEQFRANGGRVGEPFENTPILLLHHTGARTGTARVNPLAYLADGNRYVIFASKAGAPTNPDWYHNLRAHPDVTIEVGIDTLKATAHEVTGAERERLFAAMAERSPNFAEYQRKTERRIPAIVLEPVS